VAPTAPAINFWERTMHIDWSCGFKCNAALVGPVGEC